MSWCFTALWAHNVSLGTVLYYCYYCSCFINIYSKTVHVFAYAWFFGSAARIVNVNWWVDLCIISDWKGICCHCCFLTKTSNLIIYNKEAGSDDEEWYVTEVSLTQRMLCYAGSVCLTSFLWRGPRKTPRQSSALSCALASSRQARSSNSSVRCRPTPYLRWGIVGNGQRPLLLLLAPNPHPTPSSPAPVTKLGRVGVLL